MITIIQPNKVKQIYKYKFQIKNKPYIKILNIWLNNIMKVKKIIYKIHMIIRILLNNINKIFCQILILNKLICQEKETLIWLFRKKLNQKWD